MSQANAHAEERFDPRNVHGHEGQGHDDHGVPHGSLKGYVTGFVLSVILTVIPFWLVMGHVFHSAAITAALILAFGFAQILVHVVYFLHLNTSSENGWNMLALIFTAVLVVVTLSGSLWVMHEMNTHMMPMSSTPAASDNTAPMHDMGSMHHD